jgi:hypothetical protein
LGRPFAGGRRRCLEALVVTAEAREETHHGGRFNVTEVRGEGALEFGRPAMLRALQLLQNIVEPRQTLPIPIGRDVTRLNPASPSSTTPRGPCPRTSGIQAQPSWTRGMSAPVNSSMCVLSPAGASVPSG